MTKSSTVFINSRIELYGKDLYDHALYSFINRKERNPKIDQALAAFIQPIGRMEEKKQWLDTILVSSYAVNDEGVYQYSVKNTTEEQLLGLFLAMSVTNSEIVKEKFDYLFHSIIYNNYCLINADKSKTKLSLLTILTMLKIGVNLGIKEAKVRYKKFKWLSFLTLFNRDNFIVRKILGKKVYQKENFTNLIEETAYNML